MGYICKDGHLVSSIYVANVRFQTKAALASILHPRNLRYCGEASRGREGQNLKIWQDGWVHDQQRFIDIF